jgi:hypothetical protein
MKIKALGAALFLLAGIAGAQVQYGNIRGIVVDAQGGPLPGTAVSLESARFPSRTAVCSEGGVFRFLNLTPGIYKLRCELAGFKPHIRDVIDIRVGTNFDFRVVLTPATLEEQVTVIAESPIVDTKKTGTVTNVTQDMLQKLPSARDPWVMLQQTPGILVDLENVGGSSAGIQSAIVGRAGMAWNLQWNMDGVPITDMAAYGSPFYYDFDTFEEMTIVTGGQDASVQTGGVSINVVTKRGGNKLQVQARTFFTNDHLQGDNRTPELVDLGYLGDQIDRIMDYGLQVGGPILKDRLWFWLGYGVQDIRRFSIAGYPMSYKIEGINAKLNFRLSDRNRAELAFLDNGKTALGRGASAVRPPETTLDQTGRSPYIKFEDEHTFSPNFLLSLRLSYNDNRFALTPEGGTDTQAGYDLETGMFSGSYGYGDTRRPSFVASLEGNYFKERFLGGNHELKFGVEFRSTPSREVNVWPGGAFKYYMAGEPIFAEVTRGGNWDYGSDRLSVFANDAWTIGRLTLNLGLRLDREDARNYDASVDAGEVAPELLPAVTYPGYDPGVTFLTLSPRLGFTYDLGGDGKTILRGNVARYGAQQGPWLASALSSSTDAGAAFFWTDLDGDDRVSSDELDGYPADGILYFWGFDPANPANFETLNGVDKDLKADLTDELLFGLEREVFTDFALSGTFILRRNHRIIRDTFYDKATGTIIGQSDYIGPIAGSLTYGDATYDYEYWTLAATRPPGTYIFNAPDYHENCTALEIAAVKRLGHRWMMNASFTYQVYNIHYGERGYVDPTNVKIQDGQRAWGGPDSDWMAKLSFLYQLPWGINIAGFANARQGFTNVQRIYAATPERGAASLGSYMDFYIEKPGTTRLPDFYNIDLSLTKDIRFKNFGTMTLCIDAFNVFNFAHSLSRYPYVNSSRHDEIQSILNPRVIRFGLRYNF